MNKIEAQMQGKKWIDFEDIPLAAKHFYTLILTSYAPGLPEELSKSKRVYESACEYWFNNTLEDLQLPEVTK